MCTLKSAVTRERAFSRKKMNKYKQERRLNDDKNCSLAFIVRPSVTRFTLYINISLKLQNSSAALLSCARRKTLSFTNSVNIPSMPFLLLPKQLVWDLQNTGYISTMSAKVIIQQRKINYETGKLSDA